jgi:hypothetical protein
MAKAGLKDHPKFRRLVYLLKEPVPHVWGYLECLWASGYQLRSDRIGDEIDVELGAEFVGEQGRLVKALLAVGFIESREGVYFIHDFWEHAPKYVRDALAARERRAESRGDDKRRGATKSDAERRSGDATLKNATFERRDAQKHDLESKTSDAAHKEKEKEKEKEEEKEELENAHLPPRPSKATSPTKPTMTPPPKSPEDLAQLFAAWYTGTNPTMRNPVAITGFFSELVRRGHSVPEIAAKIASDRSRNESTAQFEISAGFAKFRARSPTFEGDRLSGSRAFLEAAARGEV